MRPVWTMAWLTWKAAFRFRLFWVLGGLLLVAVTGLPLLLKDDGTAQGFIQILLTYNLSILTALMGISTLWLACGTMAGDIADCQIQMVAAKPVGRWQIWAGKWVGMMLLNAALLSGAGACVFALLMWRAGQLPADQQTKLRQEIFVARTAIREETPDFEAEANRVVAEQSRTEELSAMDRSVARTYVLEGLKAGRQIVPPGYERRWTLELGLRRRFLRDQPLFARFRFYAAQTNQMGDYYGRWEVGEPGTAQRGSFPASMAAATFHELRLPPNSFDENGRLIVRFLNQTDTALLFPLEDGFEVLYREGGFGLNYARGLAVVLSWMGLLAALGLTASSLLSFPVAAFVSLSLLTVALSSGTLSAMVEEGTVVALNHETGEGGTWIDAVLLPLFKGILGVVNLVEAFAPVDRLSSGRSITWSEVGQAWFQVVIVLGGLLAAAGIWFLSRRELALPQGNN